MNNLPVGTIFTSNNIRLIIIKSSQNGYIVAPCSEQEITTNKLYTIMPNQIEKLLSLGYVDLNNNNQNILQPFSNNVVPTNINVNQNNQPNNNTTKSGKYIFDQYGFVIGEQ